MAQNGVQPPSKLSDCIDHVARNLPPTVAELYRACLATFQHGYISSERLQARIDQEPAFLSMQDFQLYHDDIVVQIELDKLCNVYKVPTFNYHHFPLRRCLQQTYANFVSEEEFREIWRRFEWDVYHAKKALIGLPWYPDKKLRGIGLDIDFDRDEDPTKPKAKPTPIRIQSSLVVKKAMPVNKKQASTGQGELEAPPNFCVTEEAGVSKTLQPIDDPTQDLPEGKAPVIKDDPGNSPSTQESSGTPRPDLNLFNLSDVPNNLPEHEVTSNLLRPDLDLSDLSDVPDDISEHSTTSHLLRPDLDLSDLSDVPDDLSDYDSTLHLHKDSKPKKRKRFIACEVEDIQYMTDWYGTKNSKNSKKIAGRAFRKSRRTNYAGQL